MSNGDASNMNNIHSKVAKIAITGTHPRVTILQDPAIKAQVSKQYFIDRFR